MTGPVLPVTDPDATGTGEEKCARFMTGWRVLLHVQMNRRLSDENLSPDFSQRDGRDIDWEQDSGRIAPDRWLASPQG